MLLEGEVAEPDYVAAKRWAEAAAAQGGAPSMTRLGLLFHNALGVERDPAQAVMWWRRGAERGDADGQAMLGAAYHLGSGVVRDTVEAYVPQVELARYITELRTATQGLGTYSWRHERFDPVPGKWSAPKAAV